MGNGILKILNVMVEGYKYGLTDLDMKDIGRMIKLI
jgi:hypothetical protein